MVAFGGPKNNHSAEDGEPSQDISKGVQERMDRFFEDLRTQTCVECAVIKAEGGQILVNDQIFREGEKHQLELPLFNTRGGFQVRQEGDEVVVSFDSQGTGPIEERMPVGKEIIAVFLGDRFYLASNIAEVFVDSDYELWYMGEKLMPNIPLKLGVGELSFENHDGAWIATWRHPNDQPGEGVHPRCRSVLTRPGNYELCYFFGALVTSSTAIIEKIDGKLLINDRPVDVEEKIPFHVDGEGELWFETYGSEVIVCFENSFARAQKPVGDLYANEKLKLTYNSGPGLEIKTISELPMEPATSEVS